MSPSPTGPGACSQRRRGLPIHMLSQNTAGHVARGTREKSTFRGSFSLESSAGDSGWWCSEGRSVFGKRPVPHVAGV